MTAAQPSPSQPAARSAGAAGPGVDTGVSPQLAAGAALADGDDGREADDGWEAMDSLSPADRQAPHRQSVGCSEGVS